MLWDPTHLHALYWYTLGLSMLHIYTKSTIIRHTVQPFTESDDTRCCNNTICPPEDEHGTDRNMSRIVM